MPKRVSIAPHLSLDELEQRYRQSKDSIQRSHYQILWLLAQRKSPYRIRQNQTSYHWWPQIASKKPA